MNEDVFPKETQNPLTMEEKIQARMHIPQDDKPVVKVSYIFDLSLFEIAITVTINLFLIIQIRSSLDIPNQGRSRNVYARMLWKKKL